MGGRGEETGTVPRTGHLSGHFIYAETCLACLAHEHRPLCVLHQVCCDRKRLTPPYHSVTEKSEQLLFFTYFPIADNTYFSRTQFKYILTEQLVSSKNIHSNGIIFFLKGIFIHSLRYKLRMIKPVREQ